MSIEWSKLPTSKQLLEVQGVFDRKKVSLMELEK